MLLKRKFILPKVLDYIRINPSSAKVVRHVLMSDNKTKKYIRYVKVGWIDKHAQHHNTHVLPSIEDLICNKDLKLVTKFSFIMWL